MLAVNVAPVPSAATKVGIVVNDPGLRTTAPVAAPDAAGIATEVCNPMRRLAEFLFFEPWSIAIV
jgi:hypothetical protein